MKSPPKGGLFFIVKNGKKCYNKENTGGLRK